MDRFEKYVLHKYLGITPNQAAEAELHAAYMRASNQAGNSTSGDLGWILPTQEKEMSTRGIVKTATTVPVHEGPGIGFRVMDYVPAGMHVNVQHTSHGWAYIGKDCWIRLAYIDFEVPGYAFNRWVETGTFNIHIVENEDGLVVDVWPGDGSGDEPLGTTWVPRSEVP